MHLTEKDKKTIEDKLEELFAKKAKRHLDESRLNQFEQELINGIKKDFAKFKKESVTKEDILNHFRDKFLYMIYG